MPEATLLGAKVAASRLQLRAICVNDISVLLQNEVIKGEVKRKQ